MRRRPGKNRTKIPVERTAKSPGKRKVRERKAVQAGWGISWANCGKPAGMSGAGNI